MTPICDQPSISIMSRMLEELQSDKCTYPTAILRRGSGRQDCTCSERSRGMPLLRSLQVQSCRPDPLRWTKEHNYTPDLLVEQKELIILKED